MRRRPPSSTRTDTLFPYTTLFRNSDLSAGGSLSDGRFDKVELEGFLSGPLTNTLRVRLAGRVARGDEWQKSHTRDDRLGKKETKAIRFLADWKPSERLYFDINLNAWQNKSDTQAPQAIALKAGRESSGESECQNGKMTGGA